MTFELHFQYHGQAEVVELPDGEFVIGRKEVCDLCLVDGGVSKRHARFISHGSVVEVEDAGSRNGTLVNGNPISRARLQPGDVVQIGTIDLTLAQSLKEDLKTTFASFDSLNSGMPMGFGADFDSQSSGLGMLEGEEVAKSSSSNSLAPTARLKVYDGQEIQELNCYPDVVVTIGGKEGNVLTLNGDGISRFHAEMYFDGANWVVKDLGSRNGVLVKTPTDNDASRRDLHVLSHGDEFQIGTARIRFHAVSAPIIDIQALLKDPRAKPILAAVAVLAFILILFPGGGKRFAMGGGKLDIRRTLNSGVRLLQEDKPNEAIELFSKLQANYPDQKVAHLFNQVANRWKDMATPFAVDWGKTYDLMRNLQKNGDQLPQFVRIWVDQETERVKLNRDSNIAFRLGQGLSERGFKYESQGALIPAVARYERAIKKYDEVSPKSQFAEQQRAEVLKLRKKIFSLLVEQGNKHFNSGNAEWSQAIGCFQRARKFITNGADTYQLNDKLTAAQINYEDEKRYQAAMEIIQSRNHRRYPQSLELLKKINKVSVIKKDALAYERWVRADMKVRAAINDYRGGNGELAIRKLTEVLNTREALGAQAKRSVTSRISQWKRIITAYREGQNFYAEGASGYRRSRALLMVVVKEESDRRNYYRRRAEKLISDMRLSIEGKDRALAVEGIKALYKADLPVAIARFEELKRSKTGRPYSAQVLNIVDYLSRGKRYNSKNPKASPRARYNLGSYFHRAYHDILLGRKLTHYEWARNVFFILKEYLPQKNPLKKRAAKHFNSIDKEIESLNRAVIGDR